MYKLLVSSLALVLVTLGWSNPGLGEQVPAPRGELRIVDKHQENWAWITFNVFEHLVEIDKDGQLVPRLATAWQWLDDRTLEMTLRQGVKFHNGEVFDADIVKLNWDEYKQDLDNLRRKDSLRGAETAEISVCLGNYSASHFEGSAYTRLRQPHMLGEYMNFTPGSRVEIRDPQTVRLVFPAPVGGVLAKLSTMHIGNRQFYRELGWGEESW